MMYVCGFNISSTTCTFFSLVWWPLFCPSLAPLLSSIFNVFRLLLSFIYLFIFFFRFIWESFSSISYFQIILTYVIWVGQRELRMSGVPLSLSLSLVMGRTYLYLRSIIKNASHFPVMGLFLKHILQQLSWAAQLISMVINWYKILRLSPNNHNVRISTPAIYPNMLLCISDLLYYI